MWHDERVFESYAGRLLVAAPQLIDPNFYRTVVLLLQHGEEGTVGLVLNRRTRELVGDHLPDWAEHTAQPGYVHYGGPVEPEMAIGLALTRDGEPTGVPGLSLIDLSSPPQAGGPSVRIYSGYSGWGRGQLEAELSSGSWYVAQASPEDPFADPQDQWRRVLRRQPGHIALVSTFPDDVTMN